MLLNPFKSLNVMYVWLRNMNTRACVNLVLASSSYANVKMDTVARSTVTGNYDCVNFASLVFWNNIHFLSRLIQVAAILGGQHSAPPCESHAFS
jgi:hypothetical protein